MHCSDAGLHSVFTQLGGLTALLDLLQSAVRMPEDSVVRQVCLLCGFLFEKTAVFIFYFT